MDQVRTQLRSVAFFSSVWPEHRSSAAGVRTFSLIQLFREQGWKISYFCTAKSNGYRDELVTLGIRVHEVELNNSSLDSILRENPFEIAIFDRFMLEEQFGWRIREVLPHCIRVLDTIDLHFLRRSRESAGVPELEGDRCRELASIYRSDLSLILSREEQKLLLIDYQIPQERLQLCSLFYDSVKVEEKRNFQQRAGFVSIGSFRHSPNRDSVQWLKKEIWPLIRAKLPQAQIDIFGSYPSREMMDLTSERDGFRVRGEAVDAIQTLSQYRVLLAPLRFGAGVKGKIADMWASGGAVVTTSIGAEGMIQDDRSFGGIVAHSAREIADSAVDLHEAPAAWSTAVSTGIEILNIHFSRTAQSDVLIETLQNLRSHLAENRARNGVGALLWHQTLRSTEYFSRWIELKNQMAMAPRLQPPIA